MLELRDTFAILPTGHGKFLDISKELSIKSHKRWQGKRVVLVVTPLISIIKTQVGELQSIGIEAVNLENKEIYAKEVWGGEGGFDIICNTRNMD